MNFLQEFTFSLIVIVWYLQWNAAALGYFSEY